MSFWKCLFINLTKKKLSPIYASIGNITAHSKLRRNTTTASKQSWGNTTTIHKLVLWLHGIALALHYLRAPGCNPGFEFHKEVNIAGIEPAEAGDIRIATSEL
ncbi:hypothetical protein COBT_003720, partial [Conglomerata obtusa]